MFTISRPITSDAVAACDGTSSTCTARSLLEAAAFSCVAATRSRLFDHVWA
jgi:hypothetical protein